MLNFKIQEGVGHHWPLPSDAYEQIALLHVVFLLRVAAVRSKRPFPIRSSSEARDGKSKVWCFANHDKRSFLSSLMNTMSHVRIRRMTWWFRKNYQKHVQMRKKEAWAGAYEKKRAGAYKKKKRELARKCTSCSSGLWIFFTVFFCWSHTMRHLSFKTIGGRPQPE